MMFYDRDSGGQIQMLIPATPRYDIPWRWPAAVLVVAVVLVMGAL